MKKIFLFVKNGGNETLVGRYDSKADAQEKVMDMVEEDSVSVFNFRIEEREYEDITNRVKSYADACKVLGIEPMDEDSMKAQGFRPDEIARRQLETITEALNEGWKPNWADTDEYKFYPWFYIEVSEVQTEGTTGADAGLSYALHGYVCACAHRLSALLPRPRNGTLRRAHIYRPLRTNFN